MPRSDIMIESGTKIYAHPGQIVGGGIRRSWQWFRLLPGSSDWEPIEGAVTNEYVAMDEDRDSDILCEMEFWNDYPVPEGTPTRQKLTRGPIGILP